MGLLGPDLALWPREDVRCVTETCVGSIYFWSLSKRRENWETFRLCAQTHTRATAACETGHRTKTVCIGNHFSVGMARERGCPSSETRRTLQTTRESLAASSRGLSHVCFKGSYREQNRTWQYGESPLVSFPPLSECVCVCTNTSMDIWTCCVS